MTTPPSKRYDSVPYLIRAGRSCIAACDAIPNALDRTERNDDQTTTEVIRDLSLTLSVLERLLTEFINTSLAAVGVTAATRNSRSALGDAVEHLQNANDTQQWSHLPAGGLASLLYHMTYVLDDTTGALEAVGVPAWKRLPTSSRGVLPLLYWAVAEHSPSARLGQLNTQLSCLLRLYLVTSEVYAKNTRRRDRSYALLISDLSDDDYAPEKQELSRRMLERSSLPQGAVMWGTTGGGLAALRHGLNVVYAGIDVGWRAKTMLPGPLNLLHWPLSLAGLALYALRPVAAERRTAAVLLEPDINFVMFVWRLADSWPARALTQALLNPALPLDEETTIAGLAVHVFGNRPGAWCVAAPHASAAASNASLRATSLQHLSSVSLSNLSDSFGGGAGGGMARLEEEHSALLCNVCDDSGSFTGINEAQQRPRPLSTALVTTAPLIFGSEEVTTLRSLDGPCSSCGSSTSNRAQDGVGLPWEVEHEEEEHHLHAFNDVNEDGLRARACIHTGGGTGSTSSPMLQNVVSASSGPVGMASASATRRARARLLRPSDAAASSPSPSVPVTTASGATAASASSASLPRAALSSTERIPPLLLWIHGGGFVGSSFSTDSTMLSRWVAAEPPSTAPFLIVYPHYSLSPEVVFPHALNELFELYLWLRPRCPTLLVGGDSAGGNLSAALILKCIAAGVPVPDGLVMAYPALNLNNSPSPSRAMHLQDPLVPIKLLQRLAAAYIGPVDYGKPAGNTSPFVHPLLASDACLKCFPPTFIISGGLDPLLDDCVDFNTRLRRLGVPGELVVHRELPHGFLAFPALAASAIDTLKLWVVAMLGVAPPPGNASVGGASSSRCG